MYTNYEICPEAVIRQHADGKWIVSNPRAHRHLELDTHGFQMLMKLANGASEPDWQRALADSRGSNRSSFTSREGLMTDPTGCGEAKALDLHGEKLFGALKEARILQKEGGEDYREFLQLQTSILDAAHLGSFHQAVGKFQVTDLRRKDTWRWWHDQKFSADGLKVRAGYYAWIQENFFKAYFAKQNLKGKRVFDFGCGNGYYSNAFAEFGAEVVGIDTSAELLAIAHKNHKRPKFLQAKDNEDCLKILEEQSPHSFDVAYMSDVLLFFFHDPKTHHQQNEALARLLKALHRMLKPKGQLFIMEPNGAFWLSGWYGNDQQAWTIVSEYREKLYHVAPTADRVISSLGASQFLVRTYTHPEICDFDSTKGMDKKSWLYAKNFPIWDFYEAIASD